MGDTTYRLNDFTFYDSERIRKHLEAMALKGWMLDRAGGTLWRYRKETPRKIHISVLYVADGSDYNPAPTAGEELLEDLSTAGGWHLQARWGQMQIYCSEEENPMPLETDPVTQVQAIRRCMKKHGIPAAWMQVLNGLLLMGLVLFQLIRFPVDCLSQSFFWVFPNAAVIALMGATSLISWHLWYGKAAAAAQEGRYISVWNARGVTLVLSGLSIILLFLMILDFSGRIGFMILCLLPAVISVAAARWMTDAMKKSGVKAKTNKRTGVLTAAVLAMVLLAVVTAIGAKYHMVYAGKPVGTYEHSGIKQDVFADEIPLRVEDLTDTAETEWSTENISQETILLANHHFRQWPLTRENMPEIVYQVVEVKVPCLYGLCRNSFLTNDYKAVDAAPWGAEEAYREIWDGRFTNRYLLCYNDTIVELSPSWDFSETQKAIAGGIFSSDT